MISKIFRVLKIYLYSLFDRRTPFSAKLLFIAALIYAVYPFDIISDFIPGLGQADDIVIVIALLKMSLSRIPKAVVNDKKSKIS